MCKEDHGSMIDEIVNILNSHNILKDDIPEKPKITDVSVELTSNNTLFESSRLVICYFYFSLYLVVLPPI